MSHPKILLFPFSINSQYFEGYAWAVELAFRMKARLQLFTTTAQGSVSIDSIYHSILEAQGHYMQHYLQNGAKSDEVLREPQITNGELKRELISHLKKEPIDIVIIDAAFSSTQAGGLNEILRTSQSAIILSEQLRSEGDKSTEPLTDRFYDHLRHAELHKLPENFYSTLGKDKSVFNYLRKLFQRNRI